MSDHAIESIVGGVVFLAFLLPGIIRAWRSR